MSGANNAIQVITPTGNSAYLVQGRTAHSLLGITTGGRSSNELSVPSGPVLEKIQKKCENLKVLVGDERSMFGRTTMGWMEQHARYAISRGANAEELWGGIPVVVFMGDDVQLPPVCDTPVYIPDCRSAPSNHGRLVWTSLDSAVEFTQIVRQNESEQQLRDVLMSLRTYSTTARKSVGYSSFSGTISVCPMAQNFLVGWMSKVCMCFLHIVWNGSAIKLSYLSVTDCQTTQ